MNTQLLLPIVLLFFFLFALGVRSFVTWGVDRATWKEDPNPAPEAGREMGQDPETEGKRGQDGEGQIDDN